MSVDSPRPITWWLRRMDDHTPLRFEMYERLPSLAIGISTDVQEIKLENAMSVGITYFKGGMMDLPLVGVQSWDDSEPEIGLILLEMLRLVTRVGRSNDLVNGQFTGIITEHTSIPTSPSTPNLLWVTLGLLYSPNGSVDILGPQPEDTRLTQINNIEWLPYYRPLPPAMRVSRYERPWVI